MRFILSKEHDNGTQFFWHHAKEIGTHDAHQTQAEYFENDHVQALKWYYADAESYMLFVKPYDAKHYVMNEDELYGIRSACKKEEMDLIIVPRFQMQTSMQVPVAMVEQFEASHLLGPGALDLLDSELQITSIIHQCSVLVNEQGTIAKAVTTKYAESADEKDTYTLVLDKPFYYFVMHGKQALFHGFVQDL